MASVGRPGGADRVGGDGLSPGGVGRWRQLGPMMRGSNVGDGFNGTA
jgi:hypothetical protein